MSADTDKPVVVVGLGSMGLGIAQSLLRAGFRVLGCDTNAAAQEHFAGLGGTPASSPAKAVPGAAALITVVVNAAQTEAVLFGADGAVAALPKGAVVLSCATMAPRDAVRLAARCGEAGVHYLDAPISGGKVRAGQGELTIMASGSAEAFATGRPVLDAIASTLHDLGPHPGIGSAFKIVNQMLAGVHIAAACEAITFAKRLGLDIEKVYEVITGSAGNSWMFENRIPHVLAGDYAPASAVDIFTKDLGIVSDIGRERTFPLPLASAALQMFLMTAAAGMGRDDDASVARLIAKTTGLDLPGLE